MASAALNPISPTAFQIVAEYTVQVLQRQRRADAAEPPQQQPQDGAAEQPQPQPQDGAAEPPQQQPQEGPAELLCLEMTNIRSHLMKIPKEEIKHICLEEVSRGGGGAGRGRAGVGGVACYRV